MERVQVVTASRVDIIALCTIPVSFITTFITCSLANTLAGVFSSRKSHLYSFSRYESRAWQITQRPNLEEQWANISQPNDFYCHTECSKEDPGTEYKVGRGMVNEKWALIYLMNGPHNKQETKNRKQAEGNKNIHYKKKPVVFQLWWPEFHRFY